MPAPHPLPGLLHKCSSLPRWHLSPARGQSRCPSQECKDSPLLRSSAPLFPLAVTSPVPQRGQLSVDTQVVLVFHPRDGPGASSSSSFRTTSKPQQGRCESCQGLCLALLLCSQSPYLRLAVAFRHGRVSRARPATVSCSRGDQLLGPQ